MKESQKRNSKKKYHGHPRFHELTREEIELHDQKNFDYAQGGHPLGNFYRVATILSLYPGLDLSDPVIVTMVYLMKQLDAVLWMKAKGHTAKVEGVPQRLGDMSIYAKLARIQEEEK